MPQTAAGRVYATRQTRVIPPLTVRSERRNVVCQVTDGDGEIIGYILKSPTRSGKGTDYSACGGFGAPYGPAFKRLGDAVAYLFDPSGSRSGYGA